MAQGLLLRAPGKNPEGTLPRPVWGRRLLCFWPCMFHVATNRATLRSGGITEQLIRPHPGPTRQQAPLQVAPAGKARLSWGSQQTDPGRGLGAGHLWGWEPPSQSWSGLQDPGGYWGSTAWRAWVRETAVSTALQTPGLPERKGQAGEIWGFLGDPLRARLWEGCRGRGGLLDCRRLGDMPFSLRLSGLPLACHPALGACKGCPGMPLCLRRFNPLWALTE